MFNWAYILTMALKIVRKILNSKLVIMYEYENAKIFWQQAEKVFLIKEIKDCLPRIYIISDLNDAKIVGKFYEKAMQKTGYFQLKVEKLIKRKSDRMYVKWKSYDESLNSWINMKDIV